MRLLQSGELGLKGSKLPQRERHEAVWNNFEATMLKGIQGTKSATLVNIPRPVNLHEGDRWNEKFFHGAPCPVSPPSLITSVGGRAVREPFENIHLIGAETSLIYIEGAVWSEIRGVRKVVEAFTLRNWTMYAV